MIPLSLLAAAAGAAMQPAAPVATCIGTRVLVTNDADLDDAAVAELRRFARAEPLRDYRRRITVFAPFGLFRGTTQNRDRTALRGEVIRAHLIAAGLPPDRIRVIGLGEHATYPFPPEMRELDRRTPASAAERDARAGFVIVESPAAAPLDCSRLAPPSD
jgi:hypothetical protein